MKSQAIKYDNNGNAYVTYFSKKLEFDNFIRCNETITHNGKEIKVHGWCALGYFGAYGLILSKDGQTAKVFYKQNF